VPKTVDSALLKRLGRNLRRLREQTGGESNPTFLTLSRYASGLGLTVADLVDGL
jgi:hypothetical protein